MFCWKSRLGRHTPQPSSLFWVATASHLAAECWLPRLEVVLTGRLDTENTGLSLASCRSSSTARKPYFSW